MRRSIQYLLRCIFLAVCAVGTPAAAQTPTLSNPFGDFESFMLPNGLTVWYRHVPGSATTSMAVTVPAGWDDDPRDREQTAHLLEHVLLSDRQGGTEAELARELTSRGGTHNGVTTPDHSYYPVHIATDEAGFALRWLYDVIAPRVFTESLVDRNREPVAIEIGARRLSTLERLARLYIQLPALRPPGFWEREFALETASARVVDPHAALHSITADDLQQFYQRHFAPPTMRLVLVSGLPRSALEPIINETFAQLPWRPPVTARDSAVVKRGESRRFSWRSGSSTHVSVLYRVSTLDELNLLRLIFIEDLLRLRLLERLRRGADKSIYSANVSFETRSGAAFMRIALAVDPSQERAVRRIVDEELHRIGTADADTVAFYADRDALERRLRVQSAAPGRLVEWAANRFYLPALHDDFPDLGEYYATVGADSIAALAHRVFTTDNRILRVSRPPPLGATGLVLLGVIIVAGVAVLYRRRYFRAADMSTIRFVGRIRPPLPARLARVGGGLLILLVAARLLGAAVEFIAEIILLPIDSPSLHLLALAVLLAAITWTVLSLAGLLPRKVLVFEDEIRLKSPTWRSIIIPASDVRGVRIVRSANGLRIMSGRLSGSGEGVLIELAGGAGHLVHVRRNAALHTAVENLIARSSIPGA